MCGIFGLLNNNENVSYAFVEREFKKGSKRGPEYSVLKTFDNNTLFGFHRLAINGLNTLSHQPIVIKRDNNSQVVLICNGEIYNYKELYNRMNVIPSTDSDCEVIIHLYIKYGIEQTLQMLDGVFSFMLLDEYVDSNASKLYVARDPFGVRPLYTLSSIKPEDDAKLVGFASEMKCLSEMHQTLNAEKQEYAITQFSPGTYSMYNIVTYVNKNEGWFITTTERTKIWKPEFVNKSYHSTGFYSILASQTQELSDVLYGVQKMLKGAVRKRCVTTERPIACLLSGGLDSSLIAGLVQEYHTKNGFPPIETYSIGLLGSEDLYYAKIVANHLKTRHTEIVVSEKDFLDAIPEVIQSIESYDTTSVRASIGNWLLGKYISENSKAKVIFNGDGSDELMGGYLYMNACPDSIEFDRESRRLLKDIHAFDVLRSDKSISSHGLEPRTPFLDRSWVQYYLSIDPDIRNHRVCNAIEKYLVRMAFSSEYYATHNDESLLPDCVLWRRKEAFSDGVSKTSRSLYEIIQEHTDKIINTTSNKNRRYSYLIPTTSEQVYYRSIFEEAYPGLEKIVPYFWMPKYIAAKDASARTLSLYNITSASEKNV